MKIKVKILKPIAEMSEEFGRYFEYQAGEEVELEKDRAEALEKSGLVKIIEIKKEKALTKPVENKAIFEPKRKK